MRCLQGLVSRQVTQRDRAFSPLSPRSPPSRSVPFASFSLQGRARRWCRWSRRRVQFSNRPFWRGGGGATLPPSLSLSLRVVFFFVLFCKFSFNSPHKAPPPPPFLPGAPVSLGWVGGGGASCFFSSGRAPRGARSGARTVPPAARVRLRGRSAGRERSGRASSRTSRLVGSVTDPGRRGEGSGGAEPRPGEAAGLGRAVSGLHARSSGPGAPHPRGDLTPRAPPPPPRTHTPPPPRSTALSGQPGVSRLTGLPSPGRPCGLTLGGAGRGTKRNGRRGSAGPRRLRRARGSPSAPGAAGAGGAGERRP